MFCNHCGAPVAADQLVCLKCGRSPVAGRPAFVARRRVAEHLHLLAILWIVVGVISCIPVPIMLALAGVARTLHTGELQHFLNVAGPMLFLSIAGFMGAVAVASLATGWGLLRLRPWGRMLALVMGFVSLVRPPFGTALGIYTLYVLLPAEAGAEYERMAAQGSQVSAAPAAPTA